MSQLAKSSQPAAPSRTESLIGKPGELPRGDTFFLGLLAASALAVVRIEAAWHRGGAFTVIAIEFAAALLLWGMIRYSSEMRSRLDRWMTVCVFVVASAPFAINFSLHCLGRIPAANEIILLATIQLTALTLACFSYRRRPNGASALLGAFSLLFSTTMSTNRLVYWIAAVYGMAGLWWLMVTYWERIETASPAANTKRAIPMRGAVVGVSSMSVLAAAIIGTGASTTYALRGFLPTSGGDRWSSVAARHGVGDGDAMVAAKDEAYSFGPVDSELFLDSEMPSLYDMFDDTYGEPPGPRKKMQKSIGLAPQDRNESDQKTAKNERGGREFSAIRKGKNRKHTELEDQKSPTVLHVVGKAPLHLAIEAYDQFDGQTWKQHDVWEEPKPLLQSRFGKPWITFRTARSRIHRSLNCYGLKIINLKTNRIPIPSHLNELHIDKVDRLDFFRWTDDGMVEMPGQEHIPQFTVIHLHSRAVNLHALRAGKDFSQVSNKEVQQRLAPYLKNSGNHRDVALQWTRSIPRGWRQVEAIVGQLRRLHHNVNATAPEDAGDVVEHFLESGEGPAYLFASTAVELLRSVGYPARLVTGFYADPDHHDHRSDQTSVYASDVHVWAEVCVDGRHWTTIEPTPGYALPSEQLTWAQRATLLFWRTVAWCRRHYVDLLIVAGLVAMMIALRRLLLDLAGRVVCRIMGMGSAEGRIVWTIRLLHWRGWLAGRAREPHKTIANWAAPLLAAAPDDQKQTLSKFLNWTDQMLYSREKVEPSRWQEVRHSCAAAVATFRLRLMVNALSKRSARSLPA